MFNTTLTDEYLALARDLGFDADAIERLVFNAVRAALLDDAAKSELEQRMRAEFAGLRAEHLAT
jgi:adenosine deaminase